MQAVILAGGEGTRLRPLTYTVPKPVIPLANRPFIAYMIEWLARHGVSDVIMACGFLSDGVRDVLGDSHEDVAIRYVTEPEARGTGGGVKFAQELLEERFLVLNGDVLTDFDLSSVQRVHAERGAKATLSLIPVDDPSAYGLVRTGPDDEILAFLEKPEPQEIDTKMRGGGGGGGCAPLDPLSCRSAGLRPSPA
ncbi:MAG: nucleotidyltransferase family protein [Solirubrobacterales bacterium]